MPDQLSLGASALVLLDLITKQRTLREEKLQSGGG